MFALINVFKGFYSVSSAADKELVNTIVVQFFLSFGKVPNM